MLFSFSRANRLISKHNFQAVFANPLKVKHKYLLSLYQPSQKPNARLGMTISKHVVKQAVQRNRLKRIIRESFRHYKESLKGLDIVILIRSECALLDKEALREDVDKLWQIMSSKRV